MPTLGRVRRLRDWILQLLAPFPRQLPMLAQAAFPMNCLRPPALSHIPALLSTCAAPLLSFLITTRPRPRTTRHSLRLASELAFSIPLHPPLGWGLGIRLSAYCEFLRVRACNIGLSQLANLLTQESSHHHNPPWWAQNDKQEPGNTNTRPARCYVQLKTPPTEAGLVGETPSLSTPAHSNTVPSPHLGASPRHCAKRWRPSWRQNGHRAP